jgi:fermentation-respiration switch protein FrsA (DUF1100 family)
MSANPPNPNEIRRKSLGRRVLRMTAILLCGYLGVILVLLFLENALVFHPVRATEDWCDPPNSLVRDVELASADGTRLHAWWCPCDNAEGVVLYCHGNAGNLSHRAQEVAVWQEQMKYSVLIFDYPGYGKSDGKPSEAGCYAAGDAAYDWVTDKQKIAADRLLIYGSSLGGGIAVDLAARRPHRALILRSAFTSVPDMAQALYPWLPARWFVRNRFDNLAKIAQCSRPVFIAHGDCDRLVPYSQGQRLYEAARTPKSFFTMKGCDHNHPAGADFFAALRRSIKELP